MREFVSISLDALLASWLGNLLAYAGLLPKLGSRVYIKKRGTDLVLESDAAFNRTIYHLHQELEFTVPFEQTFEASRRFIDPTSASTAAEPCPTPSSRCVSRRKGTTAP